MVMIDLINGIFPGRFQDRSIIGRLHQQYHHIDIVAWLSSIITQLLSRNYSLSSHSCCHIFIVNLHIEIVYRCTDTVYRHVSIIAQRNLQGHRTKYYSIIVAFVAQQVANLQNLSTTAFSYLMMTSTSFISDSVLLTIDDCEQTLELASLLLLC